MTANASPTPRTRKAKAYESVAQTIRSQVLAGELSQGEKLPPERTLAEQFGVSRVVVREAIRTLELAGILLVRKGAHGGTFVSHDYQKPLAATLSTLLEAGAISLEHLFEMRLMLEPRAAFLAAQRADSEGLASLEEIVVQAEAVADDPVRLRQANLEFHSRLAALAGNPLLSVLCDTVLAILIESLQAMAKLSGETSQRVLGYHQKIVAAVAAGRAEEARELTGGDLAQLHQSYRALGIEVTRSGKQPRPGGNASGPNPPRT